MFHKFVQHETVLHIVQNVNIRKKLWKTKKLLEKKATLAEVRMGSKLP